jgi:outer membrane protein assembly factor BamB
MIGLNAPRIPALGTLLLLLCSSTGRAANWPAWRGPTHDGISAETNAPLRWNRSQNVRWIHRLPEPGNSTPILWSNSVFVTQSTRNQRGIIAIDRRNGRARWNATEEGTPLERTERTHPFCSPSPVTDGERVIAWLGSVGVVAYDFEGKKLWHTELGPQDHQFGYGSSPVLHHHQVFLNFGPGTREFIVALDKTTGKELWRTTGPNTGGNDTYGTWSTPLVTYVGQQAQLLVALRDYFAGLDPATGREIWHARGVGLQAKASPIANGKIAVISGDLRGAEIAVQLGGTGDVTDSHRLWKENPPRRRVGSGIIVGDHIYGAQANGLMDCVHLETGDVVWAERMSGSGANSAIWSSPVLVGNRIYFHNQGGDTAIVEASPTFRQLAVNSIGEPGNASPVIADGELYLRTYAALWCIREGTTPPATASNPPLTSNRTP